MSFSKPSLILALGPFVPPSSPAHLLANHARPVPTQRRNVHHTPIKSSQHVPTSSHRHRKALPAHHRPASDPLIKRPIQRRPYAYSTAVTRGRRSRFSVCLIHYDIFPLGSLCYTHAATIWRTYFCTPRYAADRGHTGQLRSADYSAKAYTRHYSRQGTRYQGSCGDI